jgi:UDP-N-acetylglucosamine--N-acetylmuramyl-(pentapeptide) pyrophosphoryl-undecaprenol N-acetylglucosamine transferase
LPPTTSLTNILVLGGSQGSMGLNTLILEALPPLLELHPKLRLTLQCGERDLERCRKHLGSHPRVRLATFFDDIEKVYAEASLVICRSGASTLTELMILGRAAIYVPLPTASNDHQRENATSMVQLGAGLLFEQQKPPVLLQNMVEGLIQDPSRLNDLENAARSHSHPHAAESIMALLEEGQP